MAQVIDIKQAVLENMGVLPPEKQQEVLDFVEFLRQKVKPKVQLTREQPDSSIGEKLSLQEIARLPVAERHKLLAASIAATAEDFLQDPELTEFSVLDGEDWELEND